MKFLLVMLFPFLCSSQTRVLTSESLSLQRNVNIPFIYRMYASTTIIIKCDSITFSAEEDTLSTLILERERTGHGDTLMVSYSGLDKYYKPIYIDILSIHGVIVTISLGDGQARIMFSIDKDPMEEKNGTP